MKRRVTASTAAALAALLLVPGAGAATAGPSESEELRQRKGAVEQETRETRAALEETSGELVALGTALEEATAALAANQGALEAATARARAARAEEQRLAAELEAAVLAEQKARQQVGDAEARLGRVQVDAGRLARRAYAGATSWDGMSVVLGADSVADLTSRLEALDRVGLAQNQQVQAAQLARAQARSATARQEAAADAVDAARQEAEAAAAAADQAQREQERLTAESERLVGERQTLLADAEARKAAEMQRLADLEQEAAALQAEMERLAREARERAEREARERAVREQAARAAEQARAAERARAGRDAPAARPPAPAPPPDTGSEAGLLRPVTGRVTSPFGWRVHPVYGTRRMHNGTDFGNACGTPVRAAASGTVSSAAPAGSAGNRIVLDNGVVGGDALGTVYMHLQGFAVSAGQRVSRGQVIGYVGSTGASTGCHLHFEVYSNGRAVDPMSYL